MRHRREIPQRIQRCPATHQQLSTIDNQHNHQHKYDRFNQSHLKSRRCVDEGTPSPKRLNHHSVILSQEFKTIQMVADQYRLAVAKHNTMASHVWNFSNVDDLPEFEITFHGIVVHASSHSFSQHRRLHELASLFQCAIRCWLKVIKRGLPGRLRPGSLTCCRRAWGPADSLRGRSSAASPAARWARC